MRRGAKRVKAKAAAKLPVAGETQKNERSRVRQLQKQLEEALGREAEALEQQTATSEILRVISTSPTDAQPVFDMIAESAARLCEAQYCFVYRFEGQLLHFVAHHGLTAEVLEINRRAYPAPPSRMSVASRAVLERSVVQIPDVEADPDYALGLMAAAGGYRSAAAVPILRDGLAIGSIAVTRVQPGLLPERQIELLKTFADQAVIAIENVRLFTELQDKNRALTQAHAQVTEALEQQTATSEILRVIASSPTDVEPVLMTVAERAARLCNANDALIFRKEDNGLRALARWGSVPTVVQPGTVLAIDRTFVASRALIDARVLHIPDVQAAFDEFTGSKRYMGLTGVRTVLAVPLLREGVAIGVILIRRLEVKPFTDKQIDLVTTFADQAVIAIENVRLFTELSEKNEALTVAHAQVSETLEQQTATAEILRVISSSPTDVQPVFDVIVARAVHLCGAEFGRVYRFDGGVIQMVAGYGISPVGLGELQRIFPRPASNDTIVGRVILSREPMFVRDIERDEGVPALSRKMIQSLGTRSQITIPMLRAGEPIGAMTLGWAEPEAFDEQQIALVKTFADQAVIAIENVRLFTELGARNRDLSEALEQQTATAEILRVISQSQTDVQPVFDTIVRSAVRLCDGFFSALIQFDGELMSQVAEHNYTSEALEALRRVYPARPTRALLNGRAILDRAIVHIPDIEADPEHQHQGLIRAIGWRSGLFVPMLRDGSPIGVVSVTRVEAGPFSDNEIELLKTFADQAVIAIENVRLLKELQARTGELTQSVEKLTALGEVSRAVSSTLDVETVLDTIVSRASQLAGAAGCSIYEYDERTERFELRATHNYDAEFVEALQAVPLRKGEGLMGRAAEMREPIQIPDITQPGAYESSVRDTLIRFGYRALLAVPLLREDQIIGSLSFNRKAPGEFPPEVVDVLKTFATQSALAIQNARLFREIADKSRQLEVASQHKSEFLANMSHELRTPLNAIIGFSEVLNERMFGELNDKQAEYLKDIHASGTHLLSLINDILDLSKVEAGRMELELSEFDLAAAIDSALTLVRERATRRGIALGSSIRDGIGQMTGDERKIRQVLLNLLSNAIKFTPEGGQIEVAAVPNDGSVEVSVRDTGVGIAPEDQEAVFEEFRQVGASAAKQEGTGLGLALARKFIELHGGKIWVKSQVGAGSTFTFTLPFQRSAGA